MSTTCFTQNIHDPNDPSKANTDMIDNANYINWTIDGSDKPPLSSQSNEPAESDKLDKINVDELVMPSSSASEEM